MSANNFVVSSDRITVLTDEAWYGIDGVIMMFDKKLHAVESWPGAVWGRGNAVAMIYFAQLAERFSSFDELLAVSGDEIRRDIESLIEQGLIKDWLSFDGYFAGWSDRLQRLAVYCLATGDIPETVPFQWTLFDDTSSVAPGLSSHEYWITHRLGAEPDVDWNEETFDPIRHGIPFMEVQRLACARFNTETEKHAIGGGIWCAVIKADGVTMERIHAWPEDRVGAGISPVQQFPEPPLRAPSWVPAEHKASWVQDYRAGLIGEDLKPPRRAEPARPMNRAERRRLKAMGRVA